MQISRGKARHFHSIYPVHLLQIHPNDYRASDLLASLPMNSKPHALPVRRARALLTASFRHRLAVIALAVRLKVPVITALKETCTLRVTSRFAFAYLLTAPVLGAARHARRTKKRRWNFHSSVFVYYV